MNELTNEELFQQLQEKITNYMCKIPDSKTKAHEAEDLAAEFLFAQHEISECILRLSSDYFYLVAEAKLRQKQAFHASEATSVKQKEIESNADEAYLECYKVYQNINSKISYLKTKLSIFNDAHLVSRNISKGNPGI